MQNMGEIVHKRWNRQ